MAPCGSATLEQSWKSPRVSAVCPFTVPLRRWQGCTAQASESVALLGGSPVLSGQRMKAQGRAQTLCRTAVNFDHGIAADLQRCPAACPCSSMNQERLAVITNRPPSAELNTTNLHALTMRRLAGVAARVPSWASHLQE